MKLTKEQFVRETSKLIELQNTLNRLADELDIHESLFDRWFENYFKLVDELCEMDESAYDNWDGSPLDYWVFLDRTNDTRRGYRKERYDEEGIHFADAAEVYDYILANYSAAVNCRAE